MGINRTIPKFFEFSGTEDDYFYLLIRGNLRLSSFSSAGKERVIMYIESDNIFGELSLLHGTRIHEHILQAIEECEIVGFHKTMLSDTDFCRQYPHLILNLVRSIGIKAGTFFCQISESALYESQTKICRMIYHIWKENREQFDFDPKISQSEMANILGINRSSFTRVLRVLRDDGVIGHFFKRRIEIINPKKLMELADVIFIQ